MISTRAIEIVAVMEDPFNYEEYVVKCASMEFNILPEGEYAQKLGWLKVSAVKYPQLSEKEAYLKFFKDVKSASSHIPPQEETKKKGGCCGGGKVK